MSESLFGHVAIIPQIGNSYSEQNFLVRIAKNFEHI